MDRIRPAVFIAGVLLLLSATAALAAAKSETCRAEVDKLCQGVQAGEGRLVKCLKDHDADLSDACRGYVNLISQYMACLDDSLRLCPGIEPGGGRAMKCLRTHMTDLSSECKLELKKIRP